MGLARNLAESLDVVDRGPRPVDRGGRDLETLRLGALMRAAGYEQVGADPNRNYGGTLPWYGALPDVERRIETLATRRAAADAALVDALRSDDERATREADDQAQRDALHLLCIKVGRDGRLVAYKNKQAFFDDEPYQPEEMTELERRAFERMNAAHRGAAR